MAGGLDTLKKQINNAIALILMSGGDPNKAFPNKEVPVLNCT